MTEIENFVLYMEYELENDADDLLHMLGLNSASGAITSKDFGPYHRHTVQILNTATSVVEIIKESKPQS